MTRLQAPDSNAYDVLGVSPNDSAQEIDAAFHRLIEEGGYRVGVPLRGQWLRARQIKEAYATIGDPAKRRAYDESMKEGSERPLWPAAAHHDPAESVLVLPLSQWQPPPGPAPEPTAAALSPGEGELEPAPPEAIEPANDEIVPYGDQRATSPEDDPNRDEGRYGSVKLWGSAAAATLAIGALAYFTWPSGQPQLPNSEIAAQPPAGARPVNSGAPLTAGVVKQPPAAEPDGLFGEVKPWGPGDTPVASGVAVSPDTPVATETTAPSAAPTKVASAGEMQAPPGSAAASGAPAGSATALAPASPPSGQTSPAAEPAAAAATAPPPVPRGAPAAATVTVRPGAGVVHSPAEWISGGPTRSDNRGGRYVGSVIVQFTVRADGRVSNCGPARSSGNAGLDAFTCRLVEQRMRFKPALDAQGNPVASTAHARYEWGRRRRHPSLLSWIFR